MHNVDIDHEKVLSSALLHYTYLLMHNMTMMVTAFVNSLSFAKSRFLQLILQTVCAQHLPTRPGMNWDLNVDGGKALEFERTDSSNLDLGPSWCWIFGKFNGLKVWN